MQQQTSIPMSDKIFQNPTPEIYKAKNESLSEEVKVFSHARATAQCFCLQIDLSIRFCLRYNLQGFQVFFPNALIVRDRVEIFKSGLNAVFWGYFLILII